MAERNPKYDGVYVHKIDIGKLLPGDVLLTTNVEAASSKGRLQSKTILKATRGNYSHAMLCTVPPTFIEAIGHGVSNLSVMYCFAHDLKNVRLLRYNDSTIAQRAGSEALPLLGQKYSVKNAVRSILRNTKMSDVPDDELFCSALVATAFRKVGAHEFENIDPMKVTPATLEKAEYFTDVTDRVFQRILSPSNIEDMGALDGDRAASPLGGQAELFQSYCAVLLPIIKDFIATTPELTFTKNPVNFLECVMFIGAAQKGCNQLSGEIAMRVQAKVTAIDEAAYALLADGRYEEMQKAATVRDEESLRYKIEQSFLPDPDIDLEDTRAVISGTKQQIASRSKIFESAGTFGNTRTTKKWLEISDEVIDVLKRRLAGNEEALRRAFPGEKLEDDR